MSDLGGCLWLLGWLALEIWWLVWTARHLGVFAAVLFGVVGALIPYALARKVRSAGSKEDASGPPPP